MVLAMSGSSPGRIAIQPNNLNAVPRVGEGSQVVFFAQRWNDPALAGQLFSRINLLQQYQSGQFTAIQSVFIDNSTCYQAITLKCEETGQLVQCPGLSQGMFPLICATAPSFTLTLQSNIIVGATTRLHFLNTPQRYFVNPTAPFAKASTFIQASFSGSPSLITLLSAASLVPPNSNQYLVLNGFDLALEIGVGAYAGNVANIVAIQLNGIPIWADTFNVTAASFGAIYGSRTAQFQNVQQPQTPTDIYGILLGATPPGGTVIMNVTIYYSLITLF